RLAGYPGSRDAASRVRRRTARLGADRVTARGRDAAPTSQRPHSWQGAPRAVSATVEGDHDRAARLARRARHRSGTGDLRERPPRTYDTRWVRVHLGEIPPRGD